MHRCSSPALRRGHNLHSRTSAALWSSLPSNWSVCITRARTRADFLRALHPFLCGTRNGIKLTLCFGLDGVNDPCDVSVSRWV